MNLSTLTSIYVLITGGLAGLIKYLLEAFNKQVLGKITDKKTGLKYLKDVQAVYALVRTIMENHAADFSEKRKAAGDAILAAIEELTKALEDFEVNETEFDSIITKVKEAIDAWKKAK